MRNGVTLRDLCIRFNPVELQIDERTLVQFGITEGLIRRIYQVSATKILKSKTTDVLLIKHYQKEEKSASKAGRTNV
jgi:hypothetical protein